MSFSGTLFLPPPWTSGELDWQLNSGPAHKQVNAQSGDEWPVTQGKDLQMRKLEVRQLERITEDHPDGKEKRQKSAMLKSFIHSRGIY